MNKTGKYIWCEEEIAMVVLMTGFLRRASDFKP
jgi:hypothetical protein